MGILLLARNAEAPSATATVAPSESWDGTVSWSGRTVPSASGTPYGSGWTQQTIGNFDEAPYQWWDDDFDVTVLADHGDGDWIDHVEFWLEGSTTQVSSVTRNSTTGSVGFVCTIQPPSGTDGVAHLYATIVPVNGYERTIGPLMMVFNKGASISRTVVTVKTSGGDYTTIRQAVDGASDGSIVKVDAGTWTDDSSAAFSTALTYGIEVRPADGLGADDVIVARSTRSAYRCVKKKPVVFRNITFRTGAITQFYDPIEATMIGCVFEDENGVCPQPGYRFSDITTFFRTSDGQKHHLIDCTVSQPNTASPLLMRGCSLTASADAWAAVLDNHVRSDCVVGFGDIEYGDRRHDDSTLEVLSSSYDGGTGRTTITWSGTPVIDDFTSAAQGRVFVSDGAGGWTYTASAYSQSSSSYQTVVTGDHSSTFTAGKSCWVGGTAHVDSMQTFPGLTVSNIVAHRYKVVGPSYEQLVFYQSGSGFETKDVAIQLSIMDAPSQSQWQHGVTNLVWRQSVHVGSNLLGRNDLGGYVLTDNVVVGCVFESVSPDAAFASGISFSNCHFTSGTEFGTDSSSGDPLLDSEYVPQSGSDCIGRLSNPVLPYDIDGTAFGSNGSIGAKASFA